MNYESERYATKKILWSSIIAGVITVVAISILLSTLGSSLGLSMVEPLSRHPLDGVATSVVIWSVISILISLAFGGYIAGRLVTTAGMIHGFLVWATTLILAAIFGGIVLTGAVKITGSAVGSVASATGSIASEVTSIIGSSMTNLGEAGDNLVKSMVADGDETTVKQDVIQALHKSNIPSLQPDFIKAQLNGAKTEIASAVKQFALYPDDLEAILQNLADKLKARADAISSDVDRASVTKALSEHTDYSQEEINQIVNNLLDAKNKAAAKLKQQLDDLGQQVQQVKQEYQQMKQKALKDADKAASVLATTALISFFALLFGCLVCMFSGWWGARRNQSVLIR